MKNRKTVTVKGITWTILSANERVCTTCPGRFFFAGRCNSKSQWFLREHDCDITASAMGAREVGYVPYRLETDHLSLAVLDIASRNEKLPSRDPARTALIHLVQPATAEYLTSIGAFAVTLKIGRRHTGEYPTAADAREAYKRLRDESMEGGSTWPDGIITSGKTKIYLSYNGRAWADRQHTQPIEL